MEEVRILLDESYFTYLCKNGGLSFGNGYDKIEIPISKADIISLTNGNIINKDIMWANKRYLICLQDIGKELIREIIRRSPMYSHLYYDI